MFSVLEQSSLGRVPFVGCVLKAWVWSQVPSHPSWVWFRVCSQVPVASKFSPKPRVWTQSSLCSKLKHKSESGSWVWCVVLGLLFGPGSGVWSWVWCLLLGLGPGSGSGPVSSRNPGSEREAALSAITSGGLGPRAQRVCRTFGGNIFPLNPAFFKLIFLGIISYIFYDHLHN